MDIVCTCLSTVARELSTERIYTMEGSGGHRDKEGKGRKEVTRKGRQASISAIYPPRLTNAATASQIVLTPHRVLRANFIEKCTDETVKQRREMKCIDIRYSYVQ